MYQQKRKGLGTFFLGSFFVFFLYVHDSVAVKNDTLSWQKRENKLRELKSKMDSLGPSVKRLAGSGTCSEDVQCQLINIGPATCQYPFYYLIYSSVDTKEVDLVLKAREFNRVLTDYYDLSFDVPSCGQPPRPLKCLNHQCRVVIPSEQKEK